MKTLRLVCRSYRDHWLTLLLVALILTAGLFSVLTSATRLRTQIYSAEMLKTNTALQNSVYWMDSDTSLENKTSQYTKKVAAMPGVEDVLYVRGNGAVDYQGSYVNATIYSDAMQRKIPLPLAAGSWPRADADIPEVVVSGGKFFSGKKVGDILTVEGNREDDSVVQLRVRVSGVLRFPSYLPLFGSGGSEVRANHLFRPMDNFMFFSEHNYPQLIGMERVASNYLVDFRDGATPAQIEAVKNKIRETGSFITYQEIMKKTDESNAFELRRKVLRPGFFLLSVSMAFICVSALLLKKSVRTYSVYALVGCSKKRSMLLAALGLLPPVVVAGAVSTAFVAVYQQIYMYMPRDFDALVMDGWTVLAVWLYLLAVYALALLVPVVSIARHAPINLYREERE